MDKFEYEEGYAQKSFAEWAEFNEHRNSTLVGRLETIVTWFGASFSVILLVAFMFAFVILGK